jgi:hypothetical protein
MSAQYTNFRYLHSLPFGDFCMRPIIEDTNLRDAERSSRLFALLEPPSRGLCCRLIASGRQRADGQAAACCASNNAQHDR